MDLDKAIHSRRSVKKFNSKKPDWRTIIECIESMRYAPMAGNNFTLKAILIDDESKIQKLADAAQQDFFKDAKYAVVICTNSGRTEIAYEERGKVYVRQQAGAGIQNFLLKLTEAGLSTCWVGHFVDEEVKAILGIPKDIHVEAIFPIGYALKKPDEKRLLELDQFLYFNKYKNRKMNKVPTVDA